jgi:versiconal hemiacetal acetate esterase
VSNASETLQDMLMNYSVANSLDLYEGYPHYHWTWPSSKLDQPRKEFNTNLAKGVQFVIS